MDALDLLKSDHETVSTLFLRFEQGGTADVFEVMFNQLYTALTIHTQIEEDVFYPAVRNFPETSALITEAYREHATVKDLLSAISTCDVTTDEWGNLMTTLRDDVEEHVYEEENELFPKLRQLLSQQQIDQLGEALSAAKVQAATTINAQELSSLPPIEANDYSYE